jgi:hypothetical protein
MMAEPKGYVDTVVYEVTFLAVRCLRLNLRFENNELKITEQQVAVP